MYDDDRSRESLLNAYSSEVRGDQPLCEVFNVLLPFQAVFSLSVVTSEKMKQVKLALGSIIMFISVFL